MSAGSITLDVEPSGILIIKIVKTPTLNQCRTCLDAYGAAIRRHKRYVAIFDLLEADRLPEQHRRMMVSWLKEHRSLTAPRCQGIAYLLSSVLMRMMVRSVLMLSRSPAPGKVCSQYAEARAFCMQQLDKTGGAHASL